MIKATPSKKVTRRPTCQNPTCKKRFTTTVATAKYCSSKCGDAKRNSRKKVDPLEKAMKSAFFYYLATECLRAGTIEILQDHTLESLVKLHEVYKNNMRYNGSSNTFELSHIAPVKGSGHVGMLYAENLVSAPKALNRAHGNKHFGFGRPLHRLTLDPKHSVDKRWDKPSEVVQRVINYLGKDLVLAVIKTCKIKPTQRSQLVEWIIAHYDPTNECHFIALGDLSQVHELKTRQLQQIKATMLGDDTGEYIASAPTHPAIVLCNELNRLSAYRTELEVYAYALDEALSTQAGDYSLFSKHHEQMLFDVLHGKGIAVMADTLEMIVGENTQRTVVQYGNGQHHVITNTEAQRYFIQDHKDQVIITSLAAFKASLGVDTNTDNYAQVHDEITLHMLPAAVFDPWSNEVEQPPF
ncbi:hypothetical protein [Pseudomonas syringae group genomosp. 7]|uniref:hypothetical protein n=1 Tax=Pseudomonas syringae group genomosp. 7 TaxID=251699 RepID=UPI000F3F7111|nr:hypothetical protein [Pseudomonas syringae group genomosp. 7]RMQ99968.1 hypothetical protein ALP93_200079 [Pseudomonas syringae pv. helianthi]